MMTATYQLPPSIDHSNVEQVLAAAVGKLSSLPSQETLLIDCQTLSVFDSSALSALLVIKRRASERHIAIQLQAIPEKLASLAKVYGLAELVLA
jgi:phospholipid transport system transporter-binding protein